MKALWIYERVYSNNTRFSELGSCCATSYSSVILKCLLNAAISIFFHRCLFGFPNRAMFVFNLPLISRHKKSRLWKKSREKKWYSIGAPLLFGSKFCEWKINKSGRKKLLLIKKTRSGFYKTWTLNNNSWFGVQQRQIFRGHKWNIAFTCWLRITRAQAQVLTLHGFISKSFLSLPFPIPPNASFPLSFSSGEEESVPKSTE